MWPADGNIAQQTSDGLVRLEREVRRLTFHVYFSVKCWEEGGRRNHIQWTTSERAEVSHERPFYSRPVPGLAMSVLYIYWDSLASDSVMVSMSFLPSIPTTVLMEDLLQITCSSQSKNRSRRRNCPEENAISMEITRPMDVEEYYDDYEDDLNS